MIETKQASLNRIPQERASVLDKSPNSELCIYQYDHLLNNERIRSHVAELQKNLINESESFNQVNNKQMHTTWMVNLSHLH